MNEQEIKLPELPTLAGLEIAITFGPEYIGRLMQSYAREAVRMNQQAPAQAEPERRPFDLEAAKRGEPLVTRDGRSAKFVAHVPEASEYPVAAYISGSGGVETFTENGANIDEDCEDNDDLFMAPKPKRTVWVNFYLDGRAYHHDTEIEAKRSARSAIAIAVPVQIDA